MERSLILEMLRYFNRLRSLRNNTGCGRGEIRGDLTSGHDALPYTGGSATELSATDACRRKPRPVMTPMSAAGH